MFRIGKQGISICDLDNAAEIHHPHPIRDMMHDGKVMGNEQIGQPKIALQVLHDIENLRLNRHIKRGGRLVTHQELWVHSKRACNGNTLTLTT